MKKLLTLLFIINTPLSFAASLFIPYEFVANTPAVASDVNDNFTAVKTYAEDLDNRLGDLQAIVTQLQVDLGVANTTIGNLNNDLLAMTAYADGINARLITVEGNSVLELDGYLSYTNFNGYATAEFSAVNIQVTNDTGNTNGEVNGLGNIIIGYNENETSADFFCSDPQYTDQSTCEADSEAWDNNVHRGSHNLVLGRSNSYDDYSAIVSGRRNISNGIYANVGGYSNQASGGYSSVSGGTANVASGTYSSVSGGNVNTASSAFSSVSGGGVNHASGTASSISGGASNLASNTHSHVSGGFANEASGARSSVSGGVDNVASTTNASVSGGNGNTASGAASTVSGGKSRSATGTDDWVAGTLFENN